MVILFCLLRELVEEDEESPFQVWDVERLLAVGGGVLGFGFDFDFVGGAFVFCCLVGVTFPLLLTEVSLPKVVDLGVVFVFCCWVWVAFSLLLTEVSSREVEGVFSLKTFPFSVVDVVVVPLTFLSTSGGARFISLGRALVSTFEGRL